MTISPRAARERARLQVDERRSQLLELGLQLFAERNVDELSIDDIARAAGISKGLLYHYFPSKRAFFLEVVRAAAGHLVDRTSAAGTEVSPVALQDGLDAYLDFVEQNARSFVALMRGSNDPDVLQIVETTRRSIAAGRTAVIEATLATSERPGFGHALKLARWLRPAINARAARLWVEDIAYAERRYQLRAHAPVRLRTIQGGAE